MALANTASCMRALVAVLAALFPVAVSAHEVTLVPRAMAPGAAKAVTIVLRGPDTMRRQVSVGEPATFELAQCAWTIDIDSDGWWHQRQAIIANAALRVEVPIWPAGEVRGRVAMRGGGKPPAEMTLRFEGRGESSALVGEAPCPTNEGAFRCTLPAGTLDLRLRAQGCITNFFWDRRVTAGAVLDLAAMTLERGASIVGRVEMARGVTADAKQIRVIATPADLPADPRTRGTKLLPLRATIEPKGVFHVDGLAPGQYAVVGTAGRFRSPSSIIRVFADTTAELRDTIRIETQKQLRVLITPPLAPNGDRWHVEVIRSLSSHEADRITESAASPSGEFTASGLYAGSYRVEVGPKSGGRWFAQTFEVRDADITIPADIAVRRLNGIITLGGKPLRAKITLRGKLAWDVPFVSDDEGHFGGVLPDPQQKEWKVVVSSDSPVVRRTMSSVRIADDGELKIELPLTMITGVVVDADGKPQQYALVYLSGESLESTQTIADGSFSFAGLPPGKYRVHAADYLKESRPVQVDVTDDSAEALRLILDDVEKLHIRVASEFGPVSGANVLVFPTDVPATVAPLLYTDADGEVWTFTAPKAKELDIQVLAPGFTAFMFHTQVHPGTLNVRVDQRGGTLIVPTGKEGRSPYLLHNGAIEAAEMFLNSSWPSRVENDHVIIPAIDSGAYTLCMMTWRDVAAIRAGAPPPRGCVSGTLAEFGTLTLGD
jgi:hypothetical protein